MEQHGEGSASSDSEEEIFDRERQHSILPHRAGDQPFRAKVLSLGDEGALSQSSASATSGHRLCL